MGEGDTGFGVPGRDRGIGLEVWLYLYHNRGDEAVRGGHKAGA